MLLRGPAEEARARASGSGCAQRGVLGCPSGPSEGVGGRGPGRETGREVGKVEEEVAGWAGLGCFWGLGFLFLFLLFISYFNQTKLI